MLGWLYAWWDEYGPHRHDADTLRRKAERGAIKEEEKKFRVALFLIDRAVGTGEVSVFIPHWHVSDRLRKHCRTHGLRIAEPQGRGRDYQIQWDHRGTMEREDST